MCYFIRTLKIKGIWIVMVFTFFSLFYVAYQINVANISKQIALTESVHGQRKYDKNIVKNHSETGRNIMKEKTNLRELTNEKIMDLKNSSRKERESLTSTSVTGNFHNGPLSKQSNSSMIHNSTESTENNSKSKIKIGILIPTTTRNITNPVVEKLSLTTICLPSLYKTIEKVYTYFVYVGIEKGDYLESVKDKLETMFNNVKTVVTGGRTFTMTVNSISRKAYEDGMDYLVRINDDTSMQTQYWTSAGISVLQNYTPRNIGVVGPTFHQGNTGILTHDMVHRSHIEIFDFYYPPYLDNWWTDDWITKVYIPGRSTKLSSWVVKHHVRSHGTRYDVDFKKHVRLNKTLTYDRERLDEYLGRTQK